MNQAASDRELWSATLTTVGAKQDRQAFGSVFEHFAPQIKAFGLSTQATPGVHAFAEELVQETMIRVWRRASTFDGSKASATTWIFTIARNARIDLLRRGARHKSDVDADDVLGIERAVGDVPNNYNKSGVERGLAEKYLYFDSK